VTGTELLAFLKTVPANVLDREVYVDYEGHYNGMDELGYPSALFRVSLDEWSGEPSTVTLKVV
jgi:hypothetical protein